jgi:hypothetical protein
MADNRAARGRRESEPTHLGDRRRPIGRTLALAATALLFTLLPAARAGAASGGTGLGAQPTRVHTAARRHSGRNLRAANPLHGRAMWIWELPSTDDGELASIIAGAHYYRITTLIIKSSDGVDLWSQFTPALVSALHAAHLKVCAWQYVYGNRPGVEANLGADAVKDGADCLIIDAESEYEGKYVAAEAYVHDLRKQIGANYPVALAGFPYVDYHPAFPYSVFLGPGGAQYDVPQMYWRDIGTSVADVFAHTYAFNLPYDRPIYPLGQVYGHPPRSQLIRFRELARSYGAGGVSWWDWQESTAGGWDALSAPLGPAPHAVSLPAMAAIGRGAQGDLVVWIQEHLVSAGESDMIDGSYGPSTQAAVQAFQSAHGLTVDGIVGPETWAALLRYRPEAVHWVHRGRRTVADEIVSAHGSGGAPLTLPTPVSASRHARRDEIPGRLGAGGHG